MKYQYKPIRRNRDEKGIILTYSVQIFTKERDGVDYWAEFNTLKEARRRAIISD